MKRHNAIGLIGGGAWAACGAVAARAQGLAIRMATSPVDSASEPYYGSAMGFFRAAGLDVQIQNNAGNGAAIAAAVASGALDVGVSNIVSVAQAHAKHIPFVVIGPGGLYSSRTPSTYLFVPNGSSVKMASDLNGKTIAVNTLRGIPQYGTQAWLDKHGGRSETVRFTEIGPADMLVALREGRIDAGAFVEPFVIPARTIGRAIGAPFDAIASSFLITVFFTTRGWAEAHGDAVRRLQGAFAKTAAWANTHHAQSGKILLEHARLKAETLSRMPRSVFAERLDVAQIQPVIDLTVKYGGIRPFLAEEIIFQPHSA